MVSPTLYIEGGGDQKRLQRALRQGFAEFLRKAGLAGHMPSIVASGGRKQAYDDFCAALKQGKAAMLLVDSEDAVTAILPWAHLKDRQGDQWTKPDAATDNQCHLMVQCMEYWFLADREALKEFFGQGYRESALPSTGTPLESIPKGILSKSLDAATTQSKTKGKYSKGEHSFDLLARIDPAKVIKSSQWAKRFVTAIKTAMTAP